MRKTPLSRLRPLAALAALAVLAALPVSARADGPSVRLVGHVPQAAVAHARLRGRVAAGETVSLALTLPARDPQGLESLLRRLYTPGDPEQGHFLTPDEFAARFGATADDYAAAADFARRSGLVVTGTHPNRLLLDVSGPASAVERAFGVRLNRYQDRTGRVFRAPDRDPALPAGLAGKVSGVVGLDTAAVRRPHLHYALPDAAMWDAVGRKNDIGSGPNGGLSPSDVRTGYGFTSVSATGAGQTLALFELDGYDPKDVAAFTTATGLPGVPLQNVLVDGAPGTAGSGADEVSLDIEWAQALAPGLSKILVYETVSDTNQHYLDGFSRIAEDDAAKVVSTSWGLDEVSAGIDVVHAENTIFQQMSAQGQTVLTASGDSGAYDNATATDPGTLSVDDPASQPLVTCVGGTTLTTSGPGGPYRTETVWGDPTDTTLGARGAGGGGGFSAFWPAPAYQAGLVPAPPARSVPDVALNADPNNASYSFYFNGKWGLAGGTSFGAPLWAGLVSLANGQRAAQGVGPLGTLNPLLYQIGASASYDADFHDVVSGDNLYFPAHAGYDNATGWGSFQGAALLNTLVSGLPAAPAGTLTGTVTASDTNAPLPNIPVSVLSTEGVVLEGAAMTDAAGTYTLPVPAGLPLTVFASATAATGGKYGGQTAAVTVPAGQTVTQSLVVRPAVTFGAGLQMISAPDDFRASGDFAALFGFSLPTPASSPILVQWEPAQASYVFYPLSPVGTLTPGRGYWARFPAAATLHFDGTPVSTARPFPITLQPGWNQIGDPFPAPVALATLTDGVGAALPSSTIVSPTLYRYNPGTAAYVALSPATDSLQPYAGYWVYARGLTALNVPPPASH